jgi:hypothetical protein
MVTYDELLEAWLSLSRENDTVTAVSDVDIRLTQAEADALAEDVNTIVEAETDDELGELTGFSVTISDENEVVAPDGECVPI